MPRVKLTAAGNWIAADALGVAHSITAAPSTTRRRGLLNLHPSGLFRASVITDTRRGDGDRHTGIILRYFLFARFRLPELGE